MDMKEVLAVTDDRLLQQFIIVEITDTGGWFQRSWHN